MFNPVKAAGAAVSAIVGAAKIAGKAKAMYNRAIDDTDGDKIPQYQEIIAGLRGIFSQIKDGLIPLLQRQFTELKAQVVAISKQGADVASLAVALFAHVMEAEAASLAPQEGVE